MRALTAEDDFISRLSLQKTLAPYGETHVVINGKEAVEAFRIALKENRPYDDEELLNHLRSFGLVP